MKEATIILQNAKFWGGKECIQNFDGETSWECPLVNREKEMGGVSIIMAL
jgi:hypothetical protein